MAANCQSTFWVLYTNFSLGVKVKDWEITFFFLWICFKQLVGLAISIFEVTFYIPNLIKLYVATLLGKNFCLNILFEMALKCS
jgi:hypothetical protein